MTGYRSFRFRIGREGLGEAPREEDAAYIAADTYLLDTGERSTHQSGWLPPDLDQSGDVTVLQASPNELLVALSFPNVAIAREIRALHPERAIRWRAVPSTPAETTA